MKKIVLFVFLTISLLTAQNPVSVFTDVSPDGKVISRYAGINGGYAASEVIRQKAGIPFGTAPSWTAGLERQIGGMAFGDYDGDGDLDLATGCYFSNSFPPVPNYEVLIYRNDAGVLTTQPQWISADMKSTTEIRFADINQDGQLDLLAANGDIGFVQSVVYMNGNAGLSTVPSYTLNASAYTVGAAFADIDGDGDLDLAFANQGNTTTPAKPICVFFNTNGSFSSTPNWFTDDAMITNDVAFCDMNKSSLISKEYVWNAIGGYASFTLPVFPVYAVDSVIVGSARTSLYWCGNDEGVLSLAVHPPAGTQVKVYYRYEAKPDMAVSKWVNYQSAIYFNSNGNLSSSPNWVIGNSNSEKGIGWFDYNKDGFNDLAISGSGVDTRVYKNNAGVIGAQVFSYTSPTGSCQKLVSADLNNDGYPEFAIVNFSSRRVEIFNNENGVLGTGPAWTYLAGTSATSISFGDVNGDGFPDLAVGTARSAATVFINTNTVVPVELTAFSGSVTEKGVTLQWSTATETNNDRFVVERRVPGGVFLPLGVVKGNGSSTVPHFYHYLDTGVPEGNVEYRLRQVDYDGSGYIHQSISVAVTLQVNTLHVSAYPNPVTDDVLALLADVPNGQRVTVELFTVLGKRVLYREYEANNFTGQKIKIPVNELASGVYFVKIHAGKEFRTLPVVVK